MILKIDSGKLYKLAIYFGVATLYFYRKDVVLVGEGETLGDFAEKNKEILKRVCDETLELMQYELSYEQVGKIIEAYLAKSLSVNETMTGAAASTE